MHFEFPLDVSPREHELLEAGDLTGQQMLPEPQHQAVSLTLCRSERGGCPGSGVSFFSLILKR